MRRVTGEHHVAVHSFRVREVDWAQRSWALMETGDGRPAEA